MRRTSPSDGFYEASVRSEHTSFLGGLQNGSRRTMESGITGTFGGLLGRNFTTSTTISSFKVGIALGVGGEIGFDLSKFAELAALLVKRHSSKCINECTIARLDLANDRCERCTDLDRIVCGKPEFTR